MRVSLPHESDLPVQKVVNDSSANRVSQDDQTPSSHIRAVRS